jgi:hypothetical protein
VEGVGEGSVGGCFGCGFRGCIGVRRKEEIFKEVIFFFFLGFFDVFFFFCVGVVLLL